MKYVVKLGGAGLENPELLAGCTKAIAERARVETPGFFGYLLRYALPVLLPVLFIVGILFFSHQPLF